MTNQQMLYIHSPDKTHIIPIGHTIDYLACKHIDISQIPVGSAYIVSVPSGADIYIDNKPIYDPAGQIVKTPAIINDIPSIPSEHTYKLVKSGYIDAEGILFITEDQTYNITVLLCKAPSNILPILVGIAFMGIFLAMSKK